MSFLRTHKTFKCEGLEKAHSDGGFGTEQRGMATACLQFVVGHYTRGTGVSPIETGCVLNVVGTEQVQRNEDSMLSWSSQEEVNALQQSVSSDNWFHGHSRTVFIPSRSLR